MKVRRILLALSALMLAGCFRAAGDVIEPATATEPPVQFPPTSTSSGPLNPPATTTGLPITPTLVIPLTVIQPPTRAVQTTPQDTLTPQASPTRESGTVITPSGPLGPVTPAIFTATPQPLGSATSTPSGLITPTALTVDSGDGCTHTVQPGENLFRIALNNNIGLEELRAANPEVVGDLLQVGQVLNIPGCGQGLGGPEATLEPAFTETAPGGPITYTVQPGDTLYTIAVSYGITVQDIVRANAETLPNPNQLSVGQVLIIPQPTATPTPTPTPGL